MDDTRKRPQGGLNEGEGSKAADEQHRQGATDFAERTDTLQKGVEAERDVENYRDEYERAEEAGRSHSAGDLPSDLEGNQRPPPMATAHTAAAWSGAVRSTARGASGDGSRTRSRSLRSR